MEQNKKEVKEARDKLAHQQMEMANLRKEREEVEDQLAEANATIRGMEVQLRDNDSRVEEERRQTEKYQGMYQDAMKENEKLLEKLKIMEEERIQLQEEAEAGRRGAAREAELVVDLENERNKTEALENERSALQSKCDAYQKEIDSLEANLKEMTEKMSMMTAKLVEITGEDFTQQLMESTGLLSVAGVVERVNKYMGKPVFQRLYLDAEDRMVRLSQRQAQRRDLLAYESHAQQQSLYFNQKMTVMSFMPNRMGYMPTDIPHAFTTNAIPDYHNRRPSYLEQYTQDTPYANSTMGIGNQRQLVNPIRSGARSLSPTHAHHDVQQHINMPARPLTANDARRSLIVNDPDFENYHVSRSRSAPQQSASHQETTQTLQSNSHVYFPRRVLVPTTLDAENILYLLNSHAHSGVTFFSQFFLELVLQSY